MRYDILENTKIDVKKLTENIGSVYYCHKFDLFKCLVWRDLATPLPSMGWWWSPFVWIIDVVLQGVCTLYLINKDGGDLSLPLLAFRKDVVNTIFLKYSKNSKLSSSHAGIRNIPSDVCYDNTRHYQVQYVKNKACVSCEKWTLDAATWNVNLGDTCFKIFQ